MSRRFTALKPQLNRIRAWAHEGSTDAWIAHQLETTAEAVRAFRQEHGIERGGPAPLAPITPDSVVEAMLAEEAAALEAGPEPEPAKREAGGARAAPRGRAAARTRRARRRRRRRRRRAAEVARGRDGRRAEPTERASRARQRQSAAARSARRARRGGAARPPRRGEAGERPGAAEARPARRGARGQRAGDEPSRGASSRKRGRRRGRGRGAGRGLEARLLPGSVLLLDPAVTADAAFQEHWQDAGPLRVEIGADAIVLRRVAAGADRPRRRAESARSLQGARSTPETAARAY